MKKFTLQITTLLLLFSTNLLASYVATITALKGDAYIKRDAQHIPAKLGLQLEAKDNVVTQENTKMQLIFEDETIISLGHNTNFSIQEYLFEESSEPVAKFGIFQGAVRTITGKIGKIAPDKFSVHTKTATIGIRGTNFTTIVHNDSFNVFCTYGEIKVSVNEENFNIPQGYLLRIDGEGKISKKEFSAKNLKQMRDEKFGVTSTKKSSLVKEGVAGVQTNEEHLNLTIQDEKDITIQDITETTEETILNPGADVITDSTIIAQYSMNHANYLGSYSTTFNTTSLQNSGDAKLSINFGQNSALLELGNFNNPAPTLSYEIKDIDSNTFNGSLIQGEGSTEGSFFGPTGNIVNGTFDYSQNETSAKGNYNVVSTQTLY
jgi:hypothetical protein